MDYFTVKEAGEKWGLGSRIVTLYCAEGRIDGAVKKGNLWLIPKDVPKPTDGRCKKTHMLKGTEAVIQEKDISNVNKEKTQGNIVQVFQSLCENEEMLSKIIEFFPYPIQVYEPDGMMILANEASLRTMRISSKDKIVGKFNVLQDPIIDKWGENVRERISRSFQGETVQFNDLKMPVQGIIDRFGKEELCFDISFQNITCFPIYNDNLQLAYVVNVFITSKLYSGKEEMVKAKEYIESHWLEEFNIEEVAGAVNLSRYHFTRTFKKHTGMTPYGYYQDVKISRLKEKLCDKNLSIAQVFANCGVDYNGNFPRIFKEKVGMTPSQYRMSILQK